MNWQEFASLLALATAMTFTPGPNTTLSTALGANGGLRRALPFVCSVPLAWAVLLLLCHWGLGALLQQWPLLRGALRIAGVTYLLWLASLLLRVRTMAGNAASQAPQRSAQRLFWQGVALQFVNIKAWMLALAILGGWVAGRSDTTVRFAVVLAVMLFYAFVSNLCYALVGSLLRHWLAGPQGSARRLRWFNRAMATVLLATALVLLAGPGP